jgi:hypothetical protein
MSFISSLPCACKLPGFSAAAVVSIQFHAPASCIALICSVGDLLMAASPAGLCSSQGGPAGPDTCSGCQPGPAAHTRERSAAWLD